MRYLLIVSAIAAWYFSWWPFDNTERAIENSQFNVYFYYPDDKEEYLGAYSGLGGCQSAAYSKADHLDLPQSSSWSYICCRITSSSNCASKHR